MDGRITKVVFLEVLAVDVEDVIMLGGKDGEGQQKVYLFHKDGG